MGDKDKEGTAYHELGGVFYSLCDFKKARDYHFLHLSIAKELGDKAGEGAAYCNLGIACARLGDFKDAMNFHNLHLSIAKDIGDKAGQGQAYGNLGTVFHQIGDFRKAIDYHNLYLGIAEAEEDKCGKVNAYCNLGNAFRNLGDLKNAIQNHKLCLSTAKEVGDKAKEGTAYSNLGVAFQILGDLQKAIGYHNQCLRIAKEMGDKALEGTVYANLANAFRNLRYFQKALRYDNQRLSIAKEMGDKDDEGRAYHGLGATYESMGLLPEALANYQSSVRSLNYVRGLLQSEDDWKIVFRNECNLSYTGLWRVLLKQGKTFAALSAAEEGRAQALSDLMQSQYPSQAGQYGSRGLDEKDVGMFCSTSTNTVFLALQENVIHVWVLLKGEHGSYGKSKLSDYCSMDEASTFQSLVQSAYETIGVGADVTCEDRSMDALQEGYSRDNGIDKKRSPPPLSKENPLITLYNIVIGPYADDLQGNELIIVPDGPLWLAPYAAFMNSYSKHLCESFRIRVISSLTSLKLLAHCPPGYHRRSGALLVGDPWVEEVINSRGEKPLEQLPFARKEVEMIGEILKETPLIGQGATKDEVLKRLSSVSLVHIAAHGCIKTGEIVLTPNSNRRSKIPTWSDYVLTIADVLRVRLRARLVVLSCCHSGRGEVKAEGVVGIARAFMGAGARSVLVSLWAIDDEATLEFMRSFYHQLMEGRSASVSLNLAMKCLRESDKYSDAKYWAPFVLIGDDVTLEFDAKE